MLLNNNYLITESEVVTGEENLKLRPHHIDQAIARSIR